MKKQTKVAIAAGSILVLVGAAAILYEKLVASFAPQTMVITEEPGAVTSGAQNVSTQPSQEETPTIPAPNFVVLDTAGKEVSLHSLVGKPVVLNFWASWCPPCKQEMPDFEAAYKEYGSEIHFMMINMTDGGRETIASAEEYIASQGYSFPIYFDTRQEAAIEYGVSAIPTTYFINAKGNIIAYAAGAITSRHLEQGIAMMGGE